MKRQNAQRNAAETRLTLRNKSAATGLWQVVAIYSYKGQVKKFATGVHVPESYWNDAKQEVRSGGVDNVATANAHLKSVKGKLDAIIRQHVQEQGEKPTLAQIEAIYYKDKPTTETGTPVAVLLDALTAYMARRKTEIQPNSMKAYMALYQNLRLYQESTGRVWQLDTLAVDDVELFQSWLVSDRGFHNTTIERRVIALKKFLEHHNDCVSIDYRALRPLHKVKVARNFHPVTLTPEELEGVRMLELGHSPRLARVRDLFLLQTWTGLRFSDVVRLAPEHIKATKDGYHVRIDINKTGDYSDIPLFPVAAEILDRYEGNAPSISNQKFNKFIKEVMALGAQVIPSLNEELSQFHTQGTRKLSVKMPKFQWITSHTSRRTFITMNIQLGTPQHYVMKWSNHVDARSFRKYQNALQGENDAARVLLEAYRSKLAS